jgi:broad specificity phosphatase PhoE
MSTLALVRHGQASFFADNYDVLSPIGTLQSVRLGTHWAEHRDLVDEVYVGPRQRHQKTASHVGAQYRRAGLPWPEPVVLDELDEYDLSGLLNRLAPALAAQDVAFAGLVEAHRESTLERDRSRTFQQMFEALLTYWITTPTPAGEIQIESWPAFRDRVRRGLNRITEQPGHSRRVVAFTSGGFIGTATGLVLNAPDLTCLELNWRLRNCALTRFLFTPGRLSLDEFNTFPYLYERGLFTYR